VSRPGLISVDPRVVKEVLVERVADRAHERCAGEITPERLGYEARNVERELFEPARLPADWIGHELETRIAAGTPEAEAIRTLSAELADAEPEGKPAPDDERAASWRVPGPGGHVRHFVSLRSAPGRKRDFLYGFFSCCCEEALASRREGV
jgi:hypothetical protein